MKVSVEEDADSLKMVIRERRVNPIISALLLTLTILSIIIPLNMLIRVGLNGASIFGLLVFTIIAVYFTRLYLWNSRGLEIIEISKPQIVHTLDYGLFKDINKMDNSNIQLYLNTDHSSTASEKSILDDQVTTRQEAYQVILSNADQESIQLNGKINISYVNLLKERLQLID